MLLAEIRTADVEDFIAKLKEPTPLAKHHQTVKTRRPATINRYLSLLRHLFNWAIGREYIERSPFRRGTQALIRQEHEDNRRHRRIDIQEERRLLDAAPEYLRPMIVTALDAGLRRGEMLALTWADMDAKRAGLRLRGETTKSGKTRWYQSRRLGWRARWSSCGSISTKGGNTATQLYLPTRHASIVTTDLERFLKDSPVSRRRAASNNASGR